MVTFKINEYRIRLLNVTQFFHACTPLAYEVYALKNSISLSKRIRYFFSKSISAILNKDTQVKELKSVHNIFNLVKISNR